MSAGLERPSESVEFLNYFHKHAEKTESMKKRLHRISMMLMCVGVIALGCIMINFLQTWASNVHG